MESTREQKLTLDNFEGPYDLLLHLIRQRKLDILEISLIQVADQYVEFVNSQEDIDLDLTSGYLLIASQLIDLKAKSLMKTEIFIEGNPYEEEKENLLDRLIEYERLQKLSQQLKEAYHESIRMEKLSDDFIDFINNETEVIVNLLPHNRGDLKEAMKNITLKLDTLDIKETTLKVKRISPHLIRTRVQNKIKSKPKTSFIELIESNTRYYLALLLLTLLEMSKEGILTLSQNSDATDIIVRRKDEK